MLGVDFRPGFQALSNIKSIPSQKYCIIFVEQPELAIVFGRTKRRVDELTRGLKIRGFRAEGIHGDLDQNKRLRVLRDFKNGNLDVLVATDVAARGLDISGVTHAL